MASYTFRIRCSTRQSHTLIQGDELILRRGDGFEEYIRLAEIRTVRIRSGRTKAGDEWHECTVRTTHGKVRLGSLHLVGSAALNRDSVPISGLSKRCRMP